MSSKSLQKRFLLVTGIVASIACVAVASMAYAGYRFARSHEGRILPGVTIAGVDVSGMSEARALAAVSKQVDEELDRTITVAYKGRSWSVTPRELGTTSDAEVHVRAALTASREASFFRKTRIGLFDGGLGVEHEVKLRHERRRVTNYLGSLAEEVNRRPKDARISTTASGWLRFHAERGGRKIRAAASRKALLEALRTGKDRVALSVAEKKPKVTLKDLRSVLLVRIGENRLYLYRDGKIARRWTVATGLPQYPTPTGIYEVSVKRYLPTWINPAPEGWGKDLPTSIGPGIGNPLGLRALNWSDTAIRFHGTTNIGSLGHRASHGCVRMANADVIELYDLVDIGTPIYSVDVGGGSSYYGGSSLDLANAG